MLRLPPVTVSVFLSNYLYNSGQLY